MSLITAVTAAQTAADDAASAAEAATALAASAESAANAAQAAIDAVNSAASADKATLAAAAIATSLAEGAYMVRGGTPSDRDSGPTAPVDWLIEHSTSTPRGWIWTLSDLDAVNAGARFAYGHTSCCPSTGNMAVWRMGKRFRLSKAGGTLNVRGRVAPQSCTVPSSATFTSIDAQTFSGEDDAFIRVELFDSNDAKIDTAYSHTVCHDLAGFVQSSGDTYSATNAGIVASAGTSVWHWMNHSMTISTAATYIKVFMEASDGNNGIRSLGHNEANGAGLFSKLEVGYSYGMIEAPL